MLVGTESGALHVLRLDEKEKRERLWAPLLQLDGSDANPVRGCHQQVCSPCETSPCRCLDGPPCMTAYDRSTQTRLMALRRRVAMPSDVFHSCRVSHSARRQTRCLG